MHASLMNHLTKSPSYPIGGSGEIARNIVPVIKRSGGQVLVKARVSSILTSADGATATGVRMQSGEEIFAPIIISDAGVHNTFQRLLGVTPGVK